MRFISHTVEAFNRFREPFEILLDGQGLVFVEGENRDLGGSNAAGKSLAIVDTILWCLFGRMSRYGKRAVAADAVHPQRGARVVDELEIGGYYYRIERAISTRGKSHFSVHVDNATDQDMAGDWIPWEGLARNRQKRAEDAEALLGADYTAVRHAILVQGMGEPLADSGFAAQMAVLESMLRLDELSDISTDASANANLYEASVKTSQAIVTAQQEAVDTAAATLALFEAQQDYAAEIARVAAALVDAKEREAEVPGFQDLVNECRGRKEMAERQRTEASTLISGIVAEKTALETRRGALVCEACQRPFGTDADRAASEADITRLLDENAKRHGEQYRRWQESETRFQTAALKLPAYEKELAGAREAAATIPTLTEQLAQLEAARDQREALLAQAQGALDAARGNLDAAAADLASAQRAAWRYRTASKIYSRDGLQAELFLRAAPAMDAEARRLSDDIMGGAIAVTFDPIRAKANESLFRFSGSEAPTYAGLSSGQKQRADLLISMAYRAAARLRLGDPPNITVFDETFTNVDPHGLARILAALSAECQRFPGSSIFVVSNSPDLRAAIPGAKVLRVVRENNEATVSYA